MPKKGGRKGKEKKGKRPHKNKPTSKKHAMYKIEGNKVTKFKHCPRCGPGIFLGGGQSRLHCGRCSYTEFLEKKSE